MRCSKQISWVGLWSIAMLLLQSCGPEILYEKKVAFLPVGWTYAQPCTFEFDIQDTTKLYDLVAQVAHTTAYPYQNIYTRITTTYPSGKSITENLSLELAEKTGVWNSRCSGEECDITIVIQQNAFFNQLGKHRLVWEQFTRTDTLAGLSSLTFRLQATGKSRSATVGKATKQAK